jgi:hypothetical protein
MRQMRNVYSNLLVETHEQKLSGEHMMPYSLVEHLPHVGGTYCYQLQGPTS